MATAKRNLTNPPVQGHRVIDLRDDVLTIDEVARRLDVPKKTLYQWRYPGKAPGSTFSAGTCGTAGAMSSSGSTASREDASSSNICSL